MKPPKLTDCLECGEPTECVGGEVIYPHRPDLHGKSFWLCRLCDAYVGCHRRTKEPLGRPAGQVTRTMRNRAHTAFDPLWERKPGFRSRRAAYRWLAQQLDLAVEQTHIAWFDREQCKRVIEVCRAYRAKLAAALGGSK